jgi:hypothetical protein
MVPAIATMANILFRMLNSFAMMHAGSRRHAITSNSSRAASFPGTRNVQRWNFLQFFHMLEPVEDICVCYRGTAAPDKVRASIRIFLEAETLQ